MCPLDRLHTGNPLAMSYSEYHIRSAVAEDLPSIRTLVPRFIAFGPPAWHSPEQMIETMTENLVAAVLAPPSGSAVLVADAGSGTLWGVLHLQTQVDYFTQRPHGHISDLVVAAEAEGRGVGRALLSSAETWARACGFDRLTLAVFGENHRARALYERTGYGTDTIRYLKVLT